MAKKMMEDLVFNQMICSDGYKIDYAVGTTYSLDLNSFMSLPFSLGFIEDPDEAMKSSIAYLFTALRLCTGKLALFCNFSNIKAPEGQKNTFLGLIEKSIFPINPVNKMKKNPELVNFHPKVWIIQETGMNGEGSRIKVIVMSRNITMDNSLDVVCELTGVVGEKEAPQSSQDKHKPLWDFLNYLKRYADQQKAKMIERLISSLKRVRKFDLDDSPFDDYSFHPMGIKEHMSDGQELLKQFQRSKEVMVISPFIDASTLQGFSSADRKTLITREMSLSSETVEFLGKDNIYITNQQMLDNEESHPVDLHAKIYYTRDKEHRQHMHLGSANATWNGFNRNVEFLLGLRFAPHQCSYDKFRENFINEDKDCKFEQMMEIPEYTGDKVKEINETLVLRQTISAIHKAEVQPQEDGRYMISFITEEEITSEAYLYPLMCPNLKTALTSSTRFCDLELEQLSEFYVIEVGYSKQLIKIATDGIPDNRDEAICRRILNRDHFMDCISFLLADSKKAYVAEKVVNDALMGKGSRSEDSHNFDFPSLYENLLKTAYERPDVYEDMDTFIRSLPQDIIPEEFYSLYKDIQKAIKNYTR
jgi:hypothetical protein